MKRNSARDDVGKGSVVLVSQCVVQLNQRYFFAAVATRLRKIGLVTA